MKRIKCLLVLAAVSIGIGGAFAGKKMKALCEGYQQYYYVSGLGFQPVANGNYYCQQSTTLICTYYLSNPVPEVYTICTYGLYTEMPE